MHDADISAISHVAEEISNSDDKNKALEIVSDALRLTTCDMFTICELDKKEYGKFYFLEERNMSKIISYIKDNYSDGEKDNINFKNLPLNNESVKNITKLYYLEDIFRNINDESFINILKEEKITSFYTVPLLNYYATTGIMIFAYQNGKEPTEKDMQIYKIISTYVSQIMSISSLEIELDSIIEKLKNAMISIEKVSHNLYENKGIGTFLKETCEDIKNITKSEGCLILLDDKKSSLSMVESVGDNNKLAAGLKFIKSHENENRRSYQSDYISKSLKEKNINTLLYQKLINDGENIGYIVLYNSPKYYDEDVSVLEIFAIQVVLAIYVFLNNKKMLETSILNRDLELISNQQKLIMEDELIHSDDIVKMDYLNIPYKYVGGDFCKFQKISEKKYFLLMADVMGHGIISNYFVAMLKGALNTLLNLTSSPASIMNKLNKILFKELDKLNIFITAKAMLFDFDKNRLYSSNAGHTLPIAIYKKTGDKWPHEVIKSESAIALGIIEDMIYQEEVKDIKDLELIAIYTDGIIEIKNELGEEFGVERLVDFLKTQVALGSEIICQNLVKYLESFISDANLEDDITIVTVRKK